MHESTSQFDRAMELIDRACMEDPQSTSFDGEVLPAGLVYARRMTHWLLQISPGASEALRLAVRSQHLRRWMIPRSRYPMTRAGYHQWRTTLAQFHAEQAGQILLSAGYDPPIVQRVQSLIRKERLKSDPEAQTLEDVACLVFLERDYVPFAQAHEPEKVIAIIQKTWRKMSDRGHAQALSLAQSLPEAQRKLIDQAVSQQL